MEGEGRRVREGGREREGKEGGGGRRGGEKMERRGKEDQSKVINYQVLINSTLT